MADFRNHGQAIHFDWWNGTAEQLVAAGLASFDEFPGQPGRPSTSVSFRPAAGMQGRHIWACAPGYRSITRRAGGWFHLRLAVPVDEQERRAQARDAEVERRRASHTEDCALGASAPAESEILTPEWFRRSVVLHLDMLKRVITEGNVNAVSMSGGHGATLRIEGSETEDLLEMLRKVEARVAHAAIVPFVSGADGRTTLADRRARSSLHLAYSR